MILSSVRQITDPWSYILERGPPVLLLPFSSAWSSPTEIKGRFFKLRLLETLGIRKNLMKMVNCERLTS